MSGEESENDAYVQGLSSTVKEQQLYIIKLEKTLKRVHRENQALREDYKNVAQKCKEHYDTVQKLLRYELKIDEKQEQVVQGTVAGTGETFKMPLKK